MHHSKTDLSWVNGDLNSVIEKLASLKIAGMEKRATDPPAPDVMQKNLTEAGNWGLGGAAVGGALGLGNELLKPKKRRASLSGALSGALLGGAGAGGGKFLYDTVGPMLKLEERGGGKPPKRDPNFNYNTTTKLYNPTDPKGNNVTNPDTNEEIGLTAKEMALQKADIDKKKFLQNGFMGWKDTYLGRMGNRFGSTVAPDDIKDWKPDYNPSPGMPEALAGTAALDLYGRTHGGKYNTNSANEIIRKLKSTPGYEDVAKIPHSPAQYEAMPPIAHGASQADINAAHANWMATRKLISPEVKAQPGGSHPVVDLLHKANLKSPQDFHATLKDIKAKNTPAYNAVHASEMASLPTGGWRKLLGHDNYGRGFMGRSGRFNYRATPYLGAAALNLATQHLFPSIYPETSKYPSGDWQTEQALQHMKDTKNSE